MNYDVLRQLRKKAEAQILDAGVDMPVDVKSSADIKEMIYEMQVYKVEIDLQYQEIHRQNDDIQDSLEQYFHMFATAPFGYMLVDGDHILVDITLEGARRLGKPRDEILGKQIFSIFTPEDQPKIMAHYDRAKVSNQKVHCLAHIFNSPEGRFVELETSILEDPSPETGGYLATVISEGNKVIFQVPDDVAGKVPNERPVSRARNILLLGKDSETTERITKGLDEYIESEQIELVTALNGEQALEISKKQDIDLFVLDIDLPGQKNGIEICRYLKANPKTRSIYTIFVAASAEVKDIEKAAEAGGDEFYSDPFTETDLNNSVVRALKLDRSG